MRKLLSPNGELLTVSRAQKRKRMLTVRITPMRAHITKLTRMEVAIESESEKHRDEELSDA